MIISQGLTDDDNNDRSDSTNGVIDNSFTIEIMMKVVQCVVIPLLLIILM